VAEFPDGIRTKGGRGKTEGFPNSAYQRTRWPRLHRGGSFRAPSRCAAVQARSAECITPCARNTDRPLYGNVFPFTEANSHALLGRPDSALRNDGVGGSNPSCGTSDLAEVLRV
jgi:hypothetical protein